MKLRDRKKILNIPRYYPGKDDISLVITDPNYNQYYLTNYNNNIPQYPYDTGKMIKYGSDPSIELNLPGIELKGVTDYGPDNRRLSEHLSSVDWNKGGLIALSAVGFANSVYNSFSGTPNVNEVQSGVNMSNGNVGGIGYIKYGNVNLDDEIKKLNIGGNTLGAAGTGAALGASIGSIFPGAGTVIGGAIGAVAGAATGLIGGLTKKNKLKLRIAIAQGNINRINNFNRAGAQSTALSNDYYSEYGDSSAGVLHANRGKDLKYIKYEK